MKAPSTSRARGFLCNYLFFIPSFTQLLTEHPCGLEIFVVEEGVEAGAALQPFVGRDAAVAVPVGREVAVAQDDGGGVVVVQLRQQAPHTLALRVGARVAGLALRVQTTLVADADRVLVVAAAVGSRQRERTSRVDGAVACDVVVVADVTAPLPDVVAPALLQGVALPGPCGRAMQDDHGDGSHLTQLCVPMAVSNAVMIVMMMSPMRRRVRLVVGVIFFNFLRVRFFIGFPRIP